jgi:hypothetical protein
MISVQYDGTLYIRTRLDTTKQRRSKFLRKFNVAKKKFRSVQTESFKIESSGVPWKSQILWSSPFLNFSWCGLPPFSVKKLQHKTFFQFFSMG